MGAKDKRTGISRRKFRYDGCLPERRTGKDRREDPTTPTDNHESTTEDKDPSPKP
jgi:hypothetical protein